MAAALISTCTKQKELRCALSAGPWGFSIGSFILKRPAHISERVIAVIAELMDTPRELVPIVSVMIAFVVITTMI
jgi:hypothetical protein